jgi:hypothetical protein
MQGASLVGKSGELVTREEMKSKLWTADTFVDFEDGVALSSPEVGSGGPGESRTPDKRFRKPLLYPSELQAHTEVNAAR